MNFVTKPIYIYSIYIILALILFSVVLTGNFVFDDTIFVQTNQHIRSLTNFFTFFETSPITGAGLDGSNFYRPLETLIYALIYVIFGLSPFVFHLIPILLHTVNSLLVRGILSKFEFSPLSAFIGGILFLTHPAQLEAVSYISGLADPLALFFFLLGLFAILKQSWWALLWLTLSLLSKEWAVLFLPIYLLVTLYQWPKLSEAAKQFRRLCLVPTTLLISIYLVLKFTILNFTGEVGLASTVPHIGIRLITFVSIIWEYVKILFFPLHLYIERPYTYFYSILTPQFIFGITLIFTVIFGIIYFYKKDRRISLGLLWICIAIIPYTNIIPMNAIYLEHWLYLPMIGFTILFAYIINQIHNKKILLGILIGIGIIFITRGIVRNLDWANTERFYLHELSYQETARIHNNLAMYYAESERYEDAIAHYSRSLSINDSFPQTYHNLAQTYRAMGKYKEAEQMYLNALTLNPNFMHSYVGLYYLYTEIGNKDKAQEMLNILNTEQ